MAASLETVIKQLEDSAIVAPGKLKEFIPPKANPKTVEELVRELFKGQHLTKFQAQQVAQGRTKSLILGGYTILDKIGAGGMGQVFKAEHRRMKRLVAIKMLPPAMTKDAAAVARFQREVEAAAKLRHPNIVAADDADEANGVHFLVMEYVEGSDLSALVKKHGTLPGSKALNYILQAAKGLEFAHKKGVVHRDIKPANLLVDSEGTVKILDMGLARIETGGDQATQAELTGTGAVMGTVDYMAPEQALSTKGVDSRADVYSLGCTLYYLLAGKCTYDGDTLMAKLLAHREAPIPSLADVQEGVPADVQAIFSKMVAKKAEDRYPSMTAVIAALERAIAGQSAPGNLAPPANASDTGLSKIFQTLPSSPTQNPQPGVTRQMAPPVKAAGKKVNPKLILYGSIAGGVLSLIGIPLVLYFALNVGDKPPKKVAPAGATAGSPSSVAPPIAKASFNATEARAHQAAWAKYLGIKVETPNSVGQTMTLIPPGEFMMGSTDAQIAEALQVAEEIKADQKTKETIQKAEKPQHRVVLTKPFLMGETEVTVGQFKLFATATGYQTEPEKAPNVSSAKTYLNPGYAVADDSPVAAAWNDAAAFCNWLSEQEKLQPSYRRDVDTWLNLPNQNGYRLPTEAEWEYACRAGTTTHYSFGNDHQQLEHFAWHKKNAGLRSHAVGTKLPNAFGLYDMHGNLYEWCQDFWDETWYKQSSSADLGGPLHGFSHVIRGGFWDNSASDCRSAFRFNGGIPSPGFGYSNNGFRVVRTLGMSPPRDDYALEFHDPSSVAIPSLKLAPGAPLTLEAYLTATEPENVHRHVLGVDKQFGLLIAQGGTWGAQIYPAKDRKGVPIGTKKPIAVGQRIHVAAVWSATSLALFLDGKFVGRAPLENYPLPDATALFTLGGKYTGRIDEVRVSKSARYAKTFIPAPRHEPDADTLALYHCDESAGNVLTDSSPNKHHGKISGAKWVKADGSPIKGPSPPAAMPLVAGTGLARVRAKLAAAAAVTVVTMGDSMTASGGAVNWTTLLKNKLQARFKSPVTIVNVAKSLTKLPDGLAAMPEWLAGTPEPDLVLFCYGYNDWSAGARGPAFQATCENAVQTIRQATQGKADVLVMTTIPALGRWEPLAELADGARRAAQTTDAGLADLYQAFHNAGQDEAERKKLYVSDQIHLTMLGHELAAQTVFDAIAAPPALLAAGLAPPPAAAGAATIDLLPLVDLKRDVVSGNWQLTASGLTVDAGGASDEERTKRLQLPYTPPEEYDFEIEFTPTAGAHRVMQRFSAAGQSIAWEIDSKPTGQTQFTAGFSMLDGKAAPRSPVSLKYDQPLLTNGQRHRSRVEVRRGSLRVLLDDKELRSWQGDFARFTDTAIRSELPDPLKLGLITYSRPVTFHKITVREVTGRGKFAAGVSPP